MTAEIPGFRYSQEFEGIEDGDVLEGTGFYDDPITQEHREIWELMQDDDMLQLQRF